jgi:ribosome-associated heat shock protein Hsp15
LSGYDGIRLDKWLWHARFFKSRNLASQICAKGRVRVDGDVVRKAHYIVRVGNVLTFPKAKEVRVIRIEGLGTRRGPAPEAQMLYSEIEETPGG